jgi:hypothetical protein
MSERRKSVSEPPAVAGGFGFLKEPSISKTQRQTRPLPQAVLTCGKKNRKPQRTQLYYLAIYDSQFVKIKLACRPPLFHGFGL